MRDLMIVEWVNEKVYDRFPVTWDYLFQGGYFIMPSARMGCPGEIGFGYSQMPPYRSYNARCQLLDRLEITGNYRIFDGIPDPLLSAHGFGDMSDKGANFKFAILHPEDSNYELPGLAFGLEDFHGTRSFRTQYLVFTKVFIERNLEVSLGYGQERIKGFFGGAIWMPWRKSCNYPWLDGLSLVAEYDATDYKNPKFEKHPKGRHVNTPINVGLKYRYDNFLDLSVSTLRGEKLAWSASAVYNFGTTQGFLPKLDDTLPYRAPINTEPIGWLRPEEVVAQDFHYAFCDQDILLLKTQLFTNECGAKVLRLTIYNDKYRLESELRCRLNNVLAAISPRNIDEIIIVVTADEAFPIQEYHYNRDFLDYFAEQEIGEYELDVVTLTCEAKEPNPLNTTVLFKRDRELYNLILLPKTHTLFGSSRGKFKYALGLNFGSNGFLFEDVYYSIVLGKIFFSNLDDVADLDMLNPSQIINVHTDVIRYYQQRGFTLDEGYVQKTWNVGCGWYARTSAGYYEQEYGGLAGQILYYPVNSCWAIGFEYDSLYKRKYKGLGFTETVRKLNRFTPTFRRFKGSQYFLDIYYDFEPANMAFQLSLGKFLANDHGGRLLVSRYFSSGLRIGFWYTLTNAHDIINGQTYHDKGFEFSMPLDIFFKHSSRDKWGYSMSAWLRDSGFRCETGEELYYMINDMRQ